MKLTKIAAPVMAGVLTLSIGLVGCGGSKPAADDKAKTETSQTTETSQSSDTTKTTDATTSENSAIDPNTVLYWQGKLPDGKSVIYSDNALEGTSTLLIFESLDDKNAVMYDGKVTLENGESVITDKTSGDSIKMKITTANDAVMEMEIDGYGKCTLSSMTAKDFEDELNALGKEVESAVNEAADELAAAGKEIEAAVNEAADEIAKEEAAQQNSTQDTTTK